MSRSDGRSDCVSPNYLAAVASVWFAAEKAGQRQRDSVGGIGNGCSTGVGATAVNCCDCWSWR